MYTSYSSFLTKKKFLKALKMFQFKKKVFKSSENVSVQDTPSPTDVEITCS